MRLKADLSSTSHILAEAEVLKRRHHGHLPSSRFGRDHGKSNVNGGPRGGGNGAAWAGAF